MRLHKFTIIAGEKNGVEFSDGDFTFSESAGSGHTAPAAGFVTRLGPRSLSNGESFKAIFTSGSSIQGNNLILSGNFSAEPERGLPHSDAVNIMIISNKA